MLEGAVRFKVKFRRVVSFLAQVIVLDLHHTGEEFQLVDCNCGPKKTPKPVKVIPVYCSVQLPESVHLLLEQSLLSHNTH